MPISTTSGASLTPARALLRSRYARAGAVLAAALASPDMVWQASHGCSGGPPPARDSSVIAVNMDPAVLWRPWRTAGPMLRDFS
jgi:hypothetical protein